MAESTQEVDPSPPTTTTTRTTTTVEVPATSVDPAATTAVYEVDGTSDTVIVQMEDNGTLLLGVRDDGGGDIFAMGVILFVGLLSAGVSTWVAHRSRKHLKQDRADAREDLLADREFARNDLMEDREASRLHLGEDRDAARRTQLVDEKRARHFEARARQRDQLIALSEALAETKQAVLAIARVFALVEPQAQMDAVADKSGADWETRVERERIRIELENLRGNPMEAYERNLFKVELLAKVTPLTPGQSAGCEEAIARGQDVRGALPDTKNRDILAVGDKFRRAADDAIASLSAAIHVINFEEIEFIISKPDAANSDVAIESGNEYQPPTGREDSDEPPPATT